MENPTPSDILSRLYVPSSFKPQAGKNAGLDLYCSNITHDAITYNPPQNIHHNITSKQRQQIKTLKQDTTITIREADKGGKLVIMNTTDYNTSVIKTLENPSTYTPLLEDPTPVISDTIRTQIWKLLDEEIISHKLYEAIIHGTPSTPFFYGNPKVHKTIPPGSPLPPLRGIISSINGPTTRAAYYLDSLLNPLVPLYCKDHYCKDTTHLLTDINTLNNAHNFNHHSLVTIDVVDMYNSIPHADGIDACRDALHKHTTYTDSQINTISDLIQLVLDNNCFQFLDKFYKQINGTAMGSPMAPAYANLFMAHLWNTKIAPNLPITPIWLRRYIDDIITIIDDDDADVPLEPFLNTCHPRVKFTVSSPSKSTPFLDTLTHFKDNKIHTDLYTKPTDSNRYISPQSNHPPHTFNSIIYGQTLRLKRICSTNEYFLTRAAELASHLVASGYKRNQIAPIMTKVNKIDRTKLLDSGPQSKNKLDRIPYVTTFCPQAPDLRTTHNKHKHILEASQAMSRLAPHPPLIAHRRTPNLGNLLFNTKPPKQQTPGTHKCKDKRCKLNNYITTGDKITSSRNNHTHTITDFISCNTTQVIYVITCTKCNIQYTGQTKKSLRSRINNHLSAITHNLNQPVAQHFNATPHNITNDFRVQGVKACVRAEDLNKCESEIMWRLGSHKSLGGLNIDEPFIHPFSINT